MALVRRSRSTREPTQQTKYLQAGSGFLAQHSKELFFGVGAEREPFRRRSAGLQELLRHSSMLPVNHRIQIEEGVSTFTLGPSSNQPTPARISITSDAIRCTSRRCRNMADSAAEGA